MVRSLSDGPKDETRNPVMPRLEIEPVNLLDQFLQGSKARVALPPLTNLPSAMRTVPLLGPLLRTERQVRNLPPILAILMVKSDCRPVSSYCSKSGPAIRRLRIANVPSRSGVILSVRVTLPWADREKVRCGLSLLYGAEQLRA